MKIKNILLATTIALSSLFSTTAVVAQEEAAASPFSVGADVYSNYVWRGTRFGTGPAFQPSVKFTKGFFTAGVWGSFDAAGYVETDPYISLSLPAGFSLGLTDYYYPTHLDSTGITVGSSFFETDKASSYHAFEINLGYTIGGLSLIANYILNESAGAVTMGGDKYFQATYNFSNFNVFVGAGDGWHTSDTEFALCNVGLGTSKTIKVTESFSVPVTGQIVLNPEKEQLFMVVGFSL